MSYLKEIQINKTEKRVYLMDMDYHVFAELPMSTDYYEGTNSAGLAHGNAEDGVYRDTVWCDIDYPNEDDLSASYGWGYLNIDGRGRALHGGGSNLGWDGSMEPFQELLPTLGCFRMHNADVWWMCQHYRRAKAAGIDVIVHVVS